MKKLFYSPLVALALLAGSLQSATAQSVPTIPNAGFETWTSRTVLGLGGPITFQAPQSWDPGFYSSFLLAFGQAPRFDRGTIAHSGTGSLHVAVGADSVGSDVITRVPATNIPLGITAWVRNSAVLPDSEQTGVVLVILTRTQGGITDTVGVGGGTLNAPTANAWHQVVYPVVALQGAQPDTATLLVGNFGQVANFEVWVDDVEFVGSPTTGISQAASQAAPLSLSPNPATAGSATLTLTVPARVAGRAALTVTDVTGRTTGRVRIHNLTRGENKLPVPTAGLPAGAYLVTVLSAEGSRVTRLLIE